MSINSLVSFLQKRMEYNIRIAVNAMKIVSDAYGQWKIRDSMPNNKIAIEILNGVFKIFVLFDMAMRF
ncbi:hypothetical protein D9O36_15095 [Zobellia amurskyensis]|uniref:Uncharacterized protein n=1 Tax=Zobellia amurskyensis TaxID=248905 RepID=A0A7X2ZVK7_9FLAO|nr:hypothetical protein [Zobellia amurskyensis]